MKIAFRKSLAVLGIGALALTGLTACSSKGNDPAPSDPSASGGAMADQNISIMILGASQDTNAYLNDELLPKFKEETGINVTLQSSDWGSAFQKITTAAGSNQLADVVVLGSIWTAPLAERDALLPLDDYVANWDEASKVFPSMMEDGKWKDHQYSIPFGADLRAPIYRKDLLEEAGVDTANLPTTWDELRAVAEKVKEKGNTDSPIWWGLDSSIGLQQGYAQLMMQNGADYWKEDGSPNFDSPQSLEALQFMVKTFEDELSNYNLVYSGNGPRPLIAGQSAIGLGGMSEWSNADQTMPEAKDKLIVGKPIKGSSASEGSVAAWINKLAITKNSKNPDAAWELIKFIMKADNLSKFDQLYGQLPVREDLVDAEWLGDNGKALMEIAQAAKSQPPHPGMMQFGKEINTILEPAVRGDITPDEAAQQINDKLAAGAK